MYARLEAELSDVKLRWESDVAERSRENVARDVELTTLRDTDAKLRAELTQRKHDIDRCVVWFQALGNLLCVIVSVILLLPLFQLCQDTVNLFLLPPRETAN